ncbi:hypothetical protein PIB30_063216 [Stylosanthes scabra]|uniref:Senescence regulator n=1 Tax=Stylosanthes scabra TaxID=79078 RepID=A0ABU6QM03_9FABA|nr:hypothetical protein [Stylosanthes scabra]
MDLSFSSRNRRSPPSSSSDRLLGLFAVSPSHLSSTSAAGNELNEAELFYAADEASELENQLSPWPPANKNIHRSFHQNSGILAALPESDRLPVLCRKPSTSSTSTVMIPSIPRPNGENYFTQSVPGGGSGGRKFQQSAPVKVPVGVAKARKNAGDLADVDDLDVDKDDEMLPPHEIVARSSGALPNAKSFSVLEGVGRTLKGRDLRQVRNAIWRKTGFLD